MNTTVNINLTGMFNLIMDHFKPLLTDKNRFLVLLGGAGSGKSVFCVLKIIIRILIGYKTDTQHNVLVIMKTSSSMTDTVIKEFRKWLKKFNIIGTICTEKKQPAEFTFSNGSRIFFRGCDDPDKLLSLSGVTSIWIEEASRITLNDFEIIDTRLRGVIDTYPQIMLSFNPISKNNWLYGYFYSNFVDDATLHRSLLKKNKFLTDPRYKSYDPQYIKRIRSLKNTNLNKYKTYWLGEWGSLEGVIYENYKIVDTIPDNVGEIIYAIDFGFNNPSTVVRISEYDGEYYAEEMLYESGLTNNDLIKELDRIIPKKHKKSCYMYGDCAEPARIEEIYRNGYNIHKSDKSVMDGIDFVKTQKLNIHKDSYNIIKEIEGYSWKTDKDGKPLDEPLKVDDHAMDAIRYGLYTHYGDRVSYNLIVP